MTNVQDKTAQELFAHYKELWKIEDAFGEIKGTLRARPIFHWTDTRIIGHLTLCFLAYLCEAHMTHVLCSINVQIDSRAVDTGVVNARPLSAAMALRALSEVRVVNINMGGQSLWVRTDISGNAAKLFSALGVRIPAKVLKMSSNVVAQNFDHALSA